MRDEYRPHYWQSDCYLELSREDSGFYLKLGNRGLLGVLRAMESSGRNYQKFLSQFPEVVCEPLERYYLARNAMGKLDVDMLKDLLFASGWRVANWGAWLAALAPDPAYVEHLTQRRATLPHGTDVIDLAKASCGAELPSEFEEHFALLTEVRKMLAELPSVRLPMRLHPSEDQQRLSQLEAAVVGRVYHSQGLDAARDQMSKGVLGYYGLSYKEWLKKGAPPAPGEL